jgi:methionyl-tRNA formyltransferase
VRVPSELEVAVLRIFKPRFIFFLHWSWKIPPDVFDEFECVIFHMTDLPFGRGGSPLQNLIMRKIRETKISALRCVQALDAGPVYMKRPLSLSGSAEEIFSRCKEIIFGMMIEIIKSKPEPRQQEGEPVFFKRRKPEESQIRSFPSPEDLYDFIRMLDAPGYPHAFIEAENLRIEFTQARLVGGEVQATAKLILKGGS